MEDQATYLSPLTAADTELLVLEEWWASLQRVMDDPTLGDITEVLLDEQLRVIRRMAGVRAGGMRGLAAQTRVLWRETKIDAFPGPDPDDPHCLLIDTMEALIGDEGGVAVPAGTG